MSSDTSPSLGSQQVCPSLCLGDKVWNAEPWGLRLGGWSWGSGRKGLAVGNGVFGRTVGGEHLEWRWGDSWQQQLERQLELGRGAGLEDSRVGQCGLAGSPWTLSGSEGWSWGGPARGQGQLPLVWLGQAQGCLGPTSGPGGRAEGCSCREACTVACLPPCQPFREGTWQVWGSSLEGAGFPGLLLWGWLSNTTGWRTDRQVP